MQYIYHMAPAELVGDALYPLSALEERAPELYWRHRAKYDDHPSRQALPQMRVPRLGCRWSDVVQCAPLHPGLIYRALRERGLPADGARRWLQIPITALRGLPAALYDDPSGEMGHIPEAAITPLDVDGYRELAALPADTLAWYDRLAAEGRVYGHFVGVPHLLIAAAVPLADARTIRWDDEPGEVS